jgi:histidinol dehydrogenase
VLRLDSRDAGFAEAFATVVADTREADANVGADVARIVADVCARGLDAVSELTARFDRVDVSALGVEITPAERAAAAAQVPAETAAALRLAADRIAAFHALQRPADHESADATGVIAGWRWTRWTVPAFMCPAGGRPIRRPC